MDRVQQKQQIKCTTEMEKCSCSPPVGQAGTNQGRERAGGRSDQRLQSPVFRPNMAILSVKPCPMISTACKEQEFCLVQCSNYDDP